MTSFTQGLRKIESLLIFQSQLRDSDHEDQVMQYDWSGVRTRRMKRLKATLWTTGALASLLCPLFLLPEMGIAALLVLAR